MSTTGTSTAAGSGTAPGAEGTIGVPWRSPALIAILAATLVTPMDVPLISPALAEVQAVFGVSESRASLLITLYALPGILLGPFIGALADRVGRRFVLAGCLATFGIAGTGVAFTDSFSVALGLRLLQGFAAGTILSALAMTIVGDRYEGRQHDAVMGVATAMLSLGAAAYPAIGGLLAANAWNAPFLLYALALPIAGVVLVTLDDNEPSRDSDGRGYVREALRTIPLRRALTLYGVMFFAFLLLFGGMYTALPFYLADAFGYTPATVGFVTSAMLLMTGVVSTLNGRFTARASTAAILVAGFALYSIGLLGVAIASRLPLLVGGVLVFGAGSGLVTPTLFAGISALSPDHLRGGVMSFQTTIIGAGQAVGPALFAILGGAFGYQATIIGASGGAFLCTVLLPLVLQN